MGWKTEFPALWELELEALLAWFPRATYEIRGQQVVFTVPVRVQQKPLASFVEHILEISVPPQYPKTAPRVYVKSLKFPRQSRYGQHRPKHLYLDDALCLFYPEDPPNQRWLPEDGLVTLAAWAVEWLEAYYYWRFRNEWPGEDAHKDAGRRRKKL